MPIRLLIVDDHPIVRDGLKQVLEHQRTLKVMGCFANGQELLDHIYPLPDMVLMDLNMPVLDGLNTTRLIRQQHIPVKILILTMFQDVSYVQRVKEAGADGFLLKSSDVTEVLEAIHLVAAGGSYFPTFEQSEEEEPLPGPDRLSPRELEILSLIVKGLTSNEIAEKLFVSEHTVITHRRNMMKKLRINKMTQLTAFASRNGLV